MASVVIAFPTGELVWAGSDTEPASWPTGGTLAQVPCGSPYTPELCAKLGDGDA
jgi:hypothetical protein